MPGKRKTRRRGAGVLSTISKGVSLFKRKGETGRLKEFLRKNGDKTITDITIERAPVQGYITKTLDTLSRGGFSRKKRELGYDDVLHDSMVVTLDDGSKHRVEKNHVVEIKPVGQQQSKTAGDKVIRNKVKIDDNRKTNLNEMFANASKNDKDFWQYNPGGNNCQQFAEDMIVRNKLEPEKKMEKQEAKALIDSVGFLRDAPKLITDIAAVGDRVIHGEGGGNGRVRCPVCGTTMLRSSYPRHKKSKRHLSRRG